MAKDKIIFEDENGEKTELEIFLTYHSEKFNKDYIVFYKDASKDDLVAGVIDEEGNVSDIESDEEYDELDSIIEEYQDENE
jgi:uncharacterized protein YrzB (UPF0473 family)